MFLLPGRTLDVAKTAVHYFTYTVLGLITAIVGPTLLDLMHSSGTDSYGISFIFMARSMGFLIGSLAGGVILDCIKNEDLALAFSCFVVSAGAFSIPWCTSLPFLLATIAITGFAVGFCNTGSNASCLKIWGKKGAPFLQGLHFSYGVGGFIAPLLAAPFLQSHSTNSPNGTTSQDIIANSSNTSAVNNTMPTITYAYSIIATLALFATTSYVVIAIFSSNYKRRMDHDNIEPDIPVQSPGFAFSIIVVILACLQCGLISGVEISFTQMLTSYVVKSNHKLSKVAGSYMTSLFWGTFTLTRGLCIVLACKISIQRLLAFDMVLAISAVLVLKILGSVSIWGLWVGTALLGVGIASIFPGTLSWIERYININNRVASVFNLVSNILEMTVPLAIGIYMDTYPSVLFNFMLSATVCCSVLFIILNFIMGKKGEKYDARTKSYSNFVKEKSVMVT